MRSRRFLIAAMVLLIASLASHVVRFGRFTESTIITSYAPASNDPVDYATRAQVWARQGDFASAFEDAYRVPGYPAYLWPFLKLTADPFRSARLFQLGLSALLPVAMLWLGCVIGSTQMGRRALRVFDGQSSNASSAGRSGADADSSFLLGLVAGGLTLVWAPLSYFAPILVPETLSLLCLVLLMGTMAFASTGRGATKAALTIAVLLAVLIYLKPNHVLLLPPILAFMLYRHWSDSMVRKLALMVPVVAGTVALVAPWSWFASASTGMFVPLSTTQGLNLYLGVGIPAPNKAETGLHDTVARQFKLQDAARDAEVTQQAQAISVPESHRFYQSVAVAAWKERPLATAAYGLAKVAHSFGGSCRGMKDFVLGGHSVFVVLGAVWLWRQRVRREWCVFWAVSVVFSAAQAFAFLPNIRFKTVFVDLQATLILAMAVEHWWQMRVAQRSAAGTATPSSSNSSTIRAAA